jgi:monooxygenase
MSEHVDVLIVGAGLSGIGAACHLQRRCPDRSFAIVEARQASGGTWDLFRYPGVRSDSDMYTLGYRFRPWRGTKAIADGASILQYLRDTAREHGVDRRIRYGLRVRRAAWSSAEARWTVELEHADGSGATTTLTCGFLFLCSGYYRYDRGHAPAFAGSDQFRGRLVHPQHWPEDLQWDGRDVVVIGSGATAMTVVPAMAERARRVTLLQRSPTWVVARPSEDPVARRLRGRLPARLAHAIVRWKQVLLGQWVFRLCRTRPQKMGALLTAGVRMHLGPQAAALEAHFRPRYNPWEQRLCLLPDGDLFAAIRAGKVEMVTDHVDRFTAGGIRLASGRELAADIVVSATGLELEVLGVIELVVDGESVDAASTVQYKGMMLSGVPNMVSTFGYTNASWTLKSDLTAEWVCRLLRRMRRRGEAVCVPRWQGALPREAWIDFSSGYLQRSLALFPKQGPASPWRLSQSYLQDILALRFGRLDDGALRFAAASTHAAPRPVSAAVP